MNADDVAEYEVGQLVSVDIFEPGEIVDISGRSKGRGFAGTMKRHGFGGGPRTHGQSDRARAPGSIGGGTTPGKVFKGLKMAGHMGNRRVTSKGLEVIRVDAEPKPVDGEGRHTRRAEQPGDHQEALERARRKHNGKGTASS